MASSEVRNRNIRDPDRMGATAPNRGLLVSQVPKYPNIRNFYFSFRPVHSSTDNTRPECIMRWESLWNLVTLE